MLEYVTPPHGDICLTPLLRALPKAPAGNSTIAIISAIGRFPNAAKRAVPLLRAEFAEHPHVTSVLGDWGPRAASALPELHAMLTNKDLTLRVNAARAVMRIGGHRTRAMGVIREAVLAKPAEPDSWALGVLAETAESGDAPLLESLLTSEHEWISLYAAIGYARATKDAARVVPILLRDATDASPRGMKALACLSEIGPAAREVVPALRDALHSEFRRCQGGESDRVVDSDEEWSDACVSTLARVEGPAASDY